MFAWFFNPKPPFHKTVVIEWSGKPQQEHVKNVSTLGFAPKFIPK